MSVGTVGVQGTWAAAARDAVRRLGAVSLAGGVLGLLVGGVGSRLAMLLLARLNPEFTGTTSDDGFTMGHLTADTLNLLAVTTLIGVLGSGVYFAVRGLMIGPRWFQVLTVSVGPAVVVGSMLVHADGVDFLLQPAWLAIAMFVAIPLVYSALLTLVAERWLSAEGGFFTTPLWLAAVPLLLWIPLAPFLVALLAGLLAYEAVRRTAGGAAALRHPAAAWSARGLLAAVFALSLVDLVRDTRVLT